MEVVHQRNSSLTKFQVNEKKIDKSSSSFYNVTWRITDNISALIEIGRETVGG